jgi:hypothetical protein
MEKNDDFRQWMLDSFDTDSALTQTGPRSDGSPKIKHRSFATTAAAAQPLNHTQIAVHSSTTTTIASSYPPGSLMSTSSSSSSSSSSSNSSAWPSLYNMFYFASTQSSGYAPIDIDHAMKHLCVIDMPSLIYHKKIVKNTTPQIVCQVKHGRTLRLDIGCLLPMQNTWINVQELARRGYVLLLQTETPRTIKEIHFDFNHSIPIEYMPFFMTLHIPIDKRLERHFPSLTFTIHLWNRITNSCDTLSPVHIKIENAATTTKPESKTTTQREENNSHDLLKKMANEKGNLKKKLDDDDGDDGMDDKNKIIDTGGWSKGDIDCITDAIASVTSNKAGTHDPDPKSTLPDEPLFTVPPPKISNRGRPTSQYNCGRCGKKKTKKEGERKHECRPEDKAAFKLLPKIKSKNRSRFPKNVDSDLLTTSDLDSNVMEMIDKDTLS